jgi:hypothetical protein
MRHLASLCVLAAVGLAGCTGTTQTSSSPPSVSYNAPTVSYQITGGDLTEANRQAAAYCQRYSGTARLQSATATQAHYQCAGATGSMAAPGTVMTPAPGTTVVSPAAPVVVAPPVAVAPAPSGPTVSYPVNGNDVSSANVSATNYCRAQGRAAQFNGVTGGTAYYTCL